MYRNLIVVFALVFLTACATTNPAPPNLASYNGPKAIYPAVVDVFAGLSAQTEEIDVYNDIFKSGYIHRNDILIPIRFKLEVEMVGESVNVKVVDLKRYESDRRMWVRHHASLGFDPAGYAKRVSHAIVSVLNDPNEYASVKNELLSDLSFHVAVFCDAMPGGRLKWFEEEMKGRTFDIDGTLKKVRDYGVNRTRFSDENDLRYSAEMRFRADIEWEQNDLFPGFSLSMFTDNDTYSLMREGRRVRTKALAYPSDKYVSFSLKELP